MLALTKDENYEIHTTTVLRFGLRWEPVAEERKGLFGRAERKKRELMGETDPADWDAGALFLTGGDPKRYIGFDNWEPFKDEGNDAEKTSVIHSGNSIRGVGDGDDEYITVRLNDLPRRYDEVLFIGGAAKLGAKADGVRDVMATIYDGSDGTFDGVGYYEPSLIGVRNRPMLAMASVKRGPAGWDLRIIGKSYNITPGDFQSVLKGAQRMS